MPGFKNGLASSEMPAVLLSNFSINIFKLSFTGVFPSVAPVIVPPSSVVPSPKASSNLISWNVVCKFFLKATKSGASLNISIT